MSILSRIKKAIFGYDIFISYSRKDSLDYAYSIAQYFMKKGYECYIDQLSSITPGRELPPNIKDAVKRSTAFVLIGSEGAQTSEAIDKEILLFLENNKNKPLIPITIAGAINEKARWYSKIAGLALIDDTEENLKAGTPAQDVLDRIENALNFTKKSIKLRNITLTILIAALTLTGYTIWQSHLANAARQFADEAMREKATADSLKKQAIAEKEEAIEMAKRADTVAKKALSQADLADIQRREADRLKRISVVEKNNAIAERIHAEEKTVAAEKRLKVADSTLDEAKTSLVEANEQRIRLKKQSVIYNKQIEAKKELQNSAYGNAISLAKELINNELVDSVDLGSNFLLSEIINSNLPITRYSLKNRLLKVSGKVSIKQVINMGDNRILAICSNDNTIKNIISTLVVYDYVKDTIKKEEAGNYRLIAYNDKKAVFQKVANLNDWDKDYSNIMSLDFKTCNFSQMHYEIPAYIFAFGNRQSNGTQFWLADNKLLLFTVDGVQSYIIPTEILRNNLHEIAFNKTRTRFLFYHQSSEFVYNTYLNETKIEIQGRIRLVDGRKVRTIDFIDDKNALFYWDQKFQSPDNKIVDITDSKSIEELEEKFVRKFKINKNLDGIFEPLRVCRDDANNIVFNLNNENTSVDVYKNGNLQQLKNSKIQFDGIVCDPYLHYLIKYAESGEVEFQKYDVEETDFSQTLKDQLRENYPHLTNYIFSYSGKIPDILKLTTLSEKTFEVPLDSFGLSRPNCRYMYRNGILFIVFPSSKFSKTFYMFLEKENQLVNIGKIDGLELDYNLENNLDFRVSQSTGQPEYLISDGTDLFIGNTKSQRLLSKAGGGIVQFRFSPYEDWAYYIKYIPEDKKSKLFFINIKTKETQSHYIKNERLIYMDKDKIYSYSQSDPYTLKSINMEGYNPLMDKKNVLVLANQLGY